MIHGAGQVKFFTVFSAFLRRMQYAERLFSVYRKRQKYVARKAAGCGISGIHEQHSVADSRTRAVERSAVSGNAIDGLVVLRGVKIPDHFAARRCVRPQVPVYRS